MFTIFTEGINQREVESFSDRLLYNQTYFYNLSRPLMANRKNASSRRFSFGFISQTLRLLPGFDKRK